MHHGIYCGIGWGWLALDMQPAKPQEKKAPAVLKKREVPDTKEKDQELEKACKKAKVQQKGGGTQLIIFTGCTG
jgi:hypothetical protein